MNTQPNTAHQQFVAPDDMQRWVQAEALVESFGWTWDASTSNWVPPATAEPKLIDIEGAMGLTG